jgi:hypothetical protein
MYSPPFLLSLLYSLRAWWKRLQDNADNTPPFPLLEDEWNFIQQQEEAQTQGREAAANATVWVDDRGKLIDNDLEKFKQGH